MPKLTTETDAQRAVRVACAEYPASDFKPLTDKRGRQIGWTFAVRVYSHWEYGWVLAGGRVGRLYEWARDDAESRGRLAAA